jgi:predicted nucleic acid-binding Zn ribbon protein
MKQLQKTKEFLKKFKKREFRNKVIIILITFIFLVGTFLPYFFMF